MTTVGSGLPTCGVIGTGRLAASLAKALLGAGYRVPMVAGRTRERATEFVASLGGDIQAADAQAVVDGCDIVFLSVPDREIVPVAEALTWQPGQVAVHCSGALPAAVLATAVATAGAACVHPIQTFPSTTPEPERFAGITCGIEGDVDGTLRALVERLGATPLALDGIDRALYHAAAVFASNDVVALMSAATRAWEAAGLPAELARPALSPLLTAVAANVARLELDKALTGPVARGDADTVARHLSALATDGSLQALYRLLAEELLRVVPASAPAIRPLLGPSGAEDQR